MSAFVAIFIVSVIAALILKSAGVKRDTNDRVLGGVCKGIADCFDMGANGVRFLWVIWVLCAGCGVLTYIILWCILPTKK